MKLFPTFLFGAMLSATSIPSFAYDDDKVRDILAREAAVCAAFFGVLGLAADSLAKNPEFRAKVVDKADLLAKTADLLANKAEFSKRLATLHVLSVAFSTTELTSVKAKLAAGMMFDEMKSDYRNLPIIHEKYGDNCIRLSINPISRIRSLIDKKD